MVEGKDLEIGATDAGGTEHKMFIDPDGTGGAYLDLDDLRLVMGNQAAPTSASDTGRTGEIRGDGNYIYRCTATDTWKRTAISTW